MKTRVLFVLAFLGFIEASQIIYNEHQNVLFNGDAHVDIDIAALNPNDLVYGPEGKTPVNEINRLLDTNIFDVNSFDENGKSALMYALEGGDLEAADELIKHGADVNAYMFDAPLVSVARTGNLEAVKYLLERRADLYSTGDSGNNILCAAASGKNVELVRFLLDLGYPVNMKNENIERSGTALLFAAYTENSRDILELLLARGAKMTAKDNFGNRIMHAAARSPTSDNFEYLLTKGGGLLVQEANQQGETALNIINSKGCLDWRKKKAAYTAYLISEHSA